MPHVAVIVMDKHLSRLGMSEMTTSYAVERANDEPWKYTLAENLDGSTLEDQQTDAKRTTKWRRAGRGFSQF